jgi:hypothetical protein
VTACVLWQGPTFAAGYGRVLRRTYAHRAVFEAARGPIPEGMHVHHECGVRLCVNVEHLRLVTAAEHTKLHNPVLARYTPERRRTHCKHGHEYTEANTYRHSGRRHCKTCARLRMRARRAAA